MEPVINSWQYAFIDGKPAALADLEKLDGPMQVKIRTAISKRVQTANETGNLKLRTIKDTPEIGAVVVRGPSQTAFAVFARFIDDRLVIFGIGEIHEGIAPQDAKKSVGRYFKFVEQGSPFGPNEGRTNIETSKPGPKRPVARRHARPSYERPVSVEPVAATSEQSITVAFDAAPAVIEQPTVNVESYEPHEIVITGPTKLVPGYLFDDENKFLDEIAEKSGLDGSRIQGALINFGIAEFIAAPSDAKPALEEDAGAGHQHNTVMPLLQAAAVERIADMLKVDPAVVGGSFLKSGLVAYAAQQLTDVQIGLAGSADEEAIKNFVGPVKIVESWLPAENEAAKAPIISLQLKRAVPEIDLENAPISKLISELRKTNAALQAVHDEVADAVVADVKHQGQAEIALQEFDEVRNTRDYLAISGKSARLEARIKAEQSARETVRRAADKGVDLAANWAKRHTALQVALEIRGLDAGPPISLDASENEQRDAALTGIRLLLDAEAAAQETLANPNELFAEISLV